MVKRDLQKLKLKFQNSYSFNFGLFQGMPLLISYFTHTSTRENNSMALSNHQNRPSRSGQNKKEKKTRKLQASQQVTDCLPHRHSFYKATKKKWMSQVVLNQDKNNHPHSLVAHWYNCNVQPWFACLHRSKQSILAPTPQLPKCTPLTK